MRKSLLLIAVLGTFAVPAMAEEMAAATAEPTSPHTFTYNIGLYSQYIFRGLTQTGKEPALQGGVDYSHSSGFYLGTWGSNISWTGADAGALAKDASLEIDIYGGYKNTIGDTGITYDLSLLQYLYPGAKNNGLGTLGYADPNTTEAAAGLGWKWISAKWSQVVSKDGFGADDAQGTWYAELNGLYPIGDSGYSILAHVGRQEFRGHAGAASFSNDKYLSYTDYKIGATKSWDNGVNVGGYYTTTTAKDTNLAEGDPTGFTNRGRNIGADAFTFFVQKTF